MTPFEDLTLISSGLSNSVYKAKYRGHDQLYVVKTEHTDASPVGHLYREFILQRRVSKHIHIATAEAFHHVGERPLLVMEYCPQGDLFNYIKIERPTGLLQHEVRCCFGQLIAAVDYCHNQGVFHRDLKPENILLCRGQSGNLIKLADFGLATEREICAPTDCGTWAYMSPESQTKLSPVSRTYSTRSSDVWSLGIILINLVTGSWAWDRAVDSDIYFTAYKQDREVLRYVFELTGSCSKLISAILEPDPLQRLNMAEMINRFDHCLIYRDEPPRIGQSRCEDRTEHDDEYHTSQNNNSSHSSLGSPAEGISTMNDPFLECTSSRILEVLG